MVFCRKVILKLTTHRLYCHDCPTRATEYIHFFFSSYYPAWLVLWNVQLIELRQQMSIRAVAGYVFLRRHAVKILNNKYET